MPLCETYGLGFFNLLDAEFSLVIYDAQNKQFIAGHDPIGIRPLFYSYLKISHQIMFASEAKSLVRLFDAIKPFPPDYYYANGAFTCYADPATPSAFVKASLQGIESEIKERLIEGVKKRLVSDVPIGFLLSGGTRFELSL